MRMACRNLKRRDGIHPGAWMSENGRLCCKNRKLQGHEFFAKTRNGKQLPIRIDAIALSKSPVSLTLGDEVPHIFTRKPRLRPLAFLILGAKRLLQQNRHIADLLTAVVDVRDRRKSRLTANGRPMPPWRKV